MSSQKYLSQVADECSKKIIEAKEEAQYFSVPYKHLVIDDFLPESLVAECHENFPSVKDAGWEHARDSDIEVKSRTTWKSEFDIPEGIISGVRILNSAPFLLAMAERFQIPKIIPDPYFSGGGLNVTSRGGLLDVHVDGNYHDATGLNRRFNALLYLNKNWQPDWGGEFGIYDRDGSTCVKKLAPIYNRLIIFNSHDFSYHGLPDPLNFPAGEYRKSIILYYYTKESHPADESNSENPHSALWKKRNWNDKRGQKTRAYT